MSHCGFGGTLEFINFGVPMACFPHFGDQIANSELLCKANAAIYLPNKLIKFGKPIRKYENELFNAEDVKNKFEQLLKNPIYKNSMANLQLKCISTGGQKLACQTIENVYLAGSDHLLDT